MLFTPFERYKNKKNACPHQRRPLERHTGRGKHPTLFSPPTADLYLRCTRTGVPKYNITYSFSSPPPGPIEMYTRGMSSHWTLPAFGVIEKKDLVPESTKVHDEFSSERQLKECKIVLHTKSIS